MMILTNLNKEQYIHDGIIYAPIEKQIFDYLKSEFNDVKYTINKNSYNFIIDNVILELEVSKYGLIYMQLELNDSYLNKERLYTDIYLPRINFLKRKDVTKKWNEIIANIKIINIFQNEYLNLVKSYKDISDEIVKDEFAKYFNNSLLKLSTVFWSNKYNTEISINIVYNDKAPADGICYNINPNGLKEIKGYDLDNLLRHLNWDIKDTSERLQLNIDIMNYLNLKVDSFNINNFPNTLLRYKQCQDIKSLLEKYQIKSRYNR